MRDEDPYGEGSTTRDAATQKGMIYIVLVNYRGGKSHYDVRAYDVQANQLVPGSIVDKTAINEKMQGEALTRQMSDDGDMTYTLYSNTATNKAFIHILWLTDTVDNSIPFPAIARGIELPVGRSP